MKFIEKIRSLFFIPVIILLLVSSCNWKGKKVNLGQIGTAQSLSERGEDFFGENVFDSAYVNFSKSRALFASNNDNLRTSFQLLRMAQIQYISGDYSGSEGTAVEALPYINSSGNTDYQAELYNLLGMSYSKREYHKEALENYKEAMKFAKDTVFKSTIWNNIAGVYVGNEEYSKGLKIFSKLLKSDIVIQNDTLKSRALNNIGIVYMHMNNPIALGYLKQSLELRKKINDVKGLVSSYNQLAKYFITRDTKISLLEANLALEAAQKINNSEGELMALETLIDISPLGEIRGLHKKYRDVQNDFTAQKFKAKSEFSKMRYDSRVIEQSLQKQKQRTFIISLISIFIILVFIMLYFIIKIQNKKEKIKEIYKTETRISKRIHDELANDVFNTMTFVETQDFSAPEQQEKLIQNLDIIYNKTRDISRENNTVGTGENFGRVLKEMLSDYNTSQVSVITVNYDTINWKTITTDKKIAIYRVLQEIMVNMKKHSNASNVVIKFSATGKNITIQYTDNGIGFDKNQMNYKNGLQNAENRILTISGNIRFETVNEKGLKIIIAFPA